MAIAIKVPRAVYIRRLYETGLDADDIVHLTKYSPGVVKAALAAGTKGVAVQK